MILILCGLVYFVELNCLQLGPFCCRWQNLILFHGYVGFRRVVRSQFHYPTISQWEQGLFPCLCCGAMCCCRYRVVCHCAIAESSGRSTVSCLGFSILTSIVYTNLPFHPGQIQAPLSSHLCQHVFVDFSVQVILTGARGNFSVIFICMSLSISHMFINHLNFF